MGSPGRLFLASAISAGIHVYALTVANRWIDLPRLHTPASGPLLVTLRPPEAGVPEPLLETPRSAKSGANGEGGRKDSSEAAEPMPSVKPVWDANAPSSRLRDKTTPKETIDLPPDRAPHPKRAPKTSGLAPSAAAETTKASPPASAEPVSRVKQLTDSVKRPRRKSTSASNPRSDENRSQEPATGKSARVDAPSKVVGGNVRRATPDYRNNPPPKYPRIARRKGLEGTVILEVMVNARGRVGECRVNISSGHKVLDERAMKTVKRWTFDPARKDHKPVAAWVKVPIRFELR